MCVIVRLQHPPIITEGPQNHTALVGDTVHFKCDVLSDPEYLLQWLKQLNDDVVTENETRSISVVHVSVHSAFLFPLFFLTTQDRLAAGYTKHCVLLLLILGTYCIIVICVAMSYFSISNVLPSFICSASVECIKLVKGFLHARG